MAEGLRWLQVTKPTIPGGVAGVFRLDCRGHHLMTLRVEEMKLTSRQGQAGLYLKFEITYQAPADTLAYLDGTAVPDLVSGPAPLRIRFKPLPWPEKGSPILGEP